MIPLQEDMWINRQAYKQKNKQVARQTLRKTSYKVQAKLLLIQKRKDGTQNINMANGWIDRKKILI